MRGQNSNVKQKEKTLKTPQKQRPPSPKTNRKSKLYFSLNFKLNKLNFLLLYIFFFSKQNLRVEWTFIENKTFQFANDIILKLN